jgi:Zn-dependent peptidase ImmA (M78 family)
MRSGVVGNDNTRPLSVSEFQGFAINDAIAPLVFVNAKDFETAKIFTLLHEIAHIWIGRSGISNPDEILPDIALPVIETFCNAVATEALVPKNDFQAYWKPYYNFNDVQNLAKHFRVSTLVILRRAKELELISFPTFIDLLKTAQNQTQPKQKKDDGGNFFNSLLARHSPKLVEAVFDDIRQGRTMYRDGARLLNLKVPTLVKYLEDNKNVDLLA